MTAQFKNNVTATLAASISSTTTIIIVSSGQGAYFPLPSGGSYFYATLYDASNNIEIVKCTARTGDALTVLRGVDNSVANSYNAGDKVVMRVVAAALSNFAQQDGTNAFSGNNTFSGNNAFSGPITLGTNFSVKQIGSDLVFQYNGVTVAKIASDGSFTAAP